VSQIPNGRARIPYIQAGLTILVALKLIIVVYRSVRHLIPYLPTTTLSRDAYMTSHTLRTNNCQHLLQLLVAVQKLFKLCGWNKIWASGSSVEAEEGVIVNPLNYSLILKFMMGMLEPQRPLNHDSYHQYTNLGCNGSVP